MGVIPFYGATEPALFAIERAAMDRPGKVVAALDRLLPTGLIVDVGAGTGFTAERLTNPERVVVAVEPAAGMRRPDVAVPWVGAGAEALPFSADSFDAAYATWAYFFSRDFDCSPGLRELNRVVRSGGLLVIVDNAGEDEFTSLAPSDISCDPAFWAARGFEHRVVETVFEFESVKDARALLTLYFGDRAPEQPKLTWSYRVSVFVGAAN